MAIKQVGIKNSQGEYVYTDIGVNSSNVDMTSGNSLQTDFSALQTQVGTKANASDLAAKQDIMQYSTMPTASAANLGKIVQYVGTTTSNYTNGYFYRSAEGDAAGTYTWEVVSGGGVETMHEAQYQQLKADYPDPLGGKGVYDPDRYFFIDDINADGWVATNKITCALGDESTVFYHASIHPTSLVRIVAEAESTKTMPLTGDNAVYPIYAEVAYQDEGSAGITFDPLVESTDFWLLIRNEDDVEDDFTLTPNSSPGDILSWEGAGTHNAIYRGKYLGDSYTAAQKAEVESGNFEDLYIGDYWTINGVNYRIADFDYWFKSGNTECTTHHVVIVPDTILDTQKMNDTNVTTGAYVGSQMYTTNMTTAKNKIKADFGSANILNHREYLANAVANGKQSAGAWYDSQIELMTESMVYGAPHFAPACDGSLVPLNYTIGYKQFNLFRHRPDLISNLQNYWLRDVVSATYFALVGNGGLCGFNNASAANGVRPAFGLC